MSAPTWPHAVTLVTIVLLIGFRWVDGWVAVGWVGISWCVLDDWRLARELERRWRERERREP
jgi:hypothetical protein